MMSACKKSDSELSATNKFKGVTVSHWYETFNFIPNDPKNFVNYYKSKAATLLGKGSTVIPETLQGLWYMDGNPLADRTFSLSAVEAIHTNTGDVRWLVGSPTMYSWINTADAHATIAALIATNLEYELKWHDCPADVKKERESKFGMKDGSCKAADRQFAIVTPFAKVGAVRIRVPQSLAYFDLYLQPKKSDYLVWERRSKVFGALGALATVITQGMKTGGYHRYQFTQIMDGDGNRLSSFDKFESDMLKQAQDRKVSPNEFVFLTCKEGSDGCNLKHTQTVDKTSELDVLNLAKLPFF